MSVDINKPLRTIAHKYPVRIICIDRASKPEWGPIVGLVLESDNREYPFSYTADLKCWFYEDYDLENVPETEKCEEKQEPEFDYRKPAMTKSGFMAEFIDNHLGFEYPLEYRINNKYYYFNFEGKSSRWPNGVEELINVQEQEQQNKTEFKRECHNIGSSIFYVAESIKRIENLLVDFFKNKKIGE